MAAVSTPAELCDTAKSKEAAAEERLATDAVGDDSKAATSDVCAAEHPQQLLRETPVLPDQAGRLADLHAYIIAGMTVLSTIFSCLL